jgi:hypothetical protein
MPLAGSTSPKPELQKQTSSRHVIEGNWQKITVSNNDRNGAESGPSNSGPPHLPFSDVGSGRCFLAPVSTASQATFPFLEICHGPGSCSALPFHQRRQPLIAVPRFQLRRIVGVARLLASKRDLRVAKATLRTDGRHLSIGVETLHSGVQLHLPSQAEREERTAPFSAFADAEGPHDSPVCFDVNPTGIVRTRWTEKGIDQFRDYEVGSLGGKSGLQTPAEFTEAGDASSCLRLLTDAAACASGDRGRYALDCIALRGKSGDVVGTNGRHLLRAGGFRFPWDDVVLVPACRVFSSKEFAGAEGFLVGRTADHVVFTIGPWTLWLAIEKEGRFPDVDAVLRDGARADSSFELSPNDAKFLADSLPLLPGAADQYRPVHVRLDGDVRVQGRAADGDQATELILAGSRATGAPTCFQTDREFLLQALRMGLRSFKAWKNNTPIVAAQGDRTYAWQPLSREPLSPHGNVVQIQSPTVETPCMSSAPNFIETKKGPAMHRENSKPESVASETGSESPEVSKDTLQALIDEAESLKQQVREVSTRLSELIVGLRQHRKQAKLVQSTLASLRQLQHVA